MCRVLPYLKWKEVREYRKLHLKRRIKKLMKLKERKGAKRLEVRNSRKRISGMKEYLWAKD